MLKKLGGGEFHTARGEQIIDFFGYKRFEFFHNVKTSSFETGFESFRSSLICI